MITYSIVRASQGSWKWQTPYVVKGYKAEKVKNGFIYFRSNGFKSAKLTYERAFSADENSVKIEAANLLDKWMVSVCARYWWD